MKRLTVALVAVLAGCSPTATLDQETTTSVTVAASTTTTLVGRDAAAGLGDRMFPDLGNEGYDVASYDIDLKLDGALRTVEGRVEMRATATIPLRSFTFDLVGYEIVAVTVDGEAADWQRSQRDVRVTPTTTIPPGETFSVVTEYRGVLTAISVTEFPFATGWQQGTSSRFLFSQPDGASGVFPANDHPSDRADVHLTVRVPSPHQVVSGGTRLPAEEGDDSTVHRFAIDEVAPYLLPLAVGSFESVTGNDGVTSWISQGGDLPSGFDRQAEILGFLVDELGAYPFSTVGAMVVDSDLPAALETQTLPTYTTVSAAWGEQVIAHELAHQWFGNEIALGQWDDIWLNEGFATFMTWRWIEHDQGRAAYEAQVNRAWETVAAANLPPPDHPPGQDLFNLSVYQRGGLALVALREFVGDERFFSFLAEYVAAFSDEVVTTERFLTFVLVVLGPDAEDLLISWVQDPELPPNPLG